MAQYAEGQRLKGSDGNIYVVRNGVPVRDGPTPLAANPKLPGELAGQGLTNQGKTLDNAYNQQTLAARTREANAQAVSAEIKAKQDREAYDAAHPTVSTNGLYGADYLKTLPAGEAAMVKALDEGRLAFPSSRALTSPIWNQRLQEVSQYDPTFDATNFNARAKGRAAAISGKLGASTNALNTAMGHLGTLYSQIEGTASHGPWSVGGVPVPLATTVNAIENAAMKGSGDQGVTNFKDTAQKLADELETAYRGSGGAEAGVVRQLQSLSVNASREQKIGVIKNAMDLLASKMSANLAQYNFGTGGKPTWDMLDQHTMDVLNTPQFKDIRDKYFAPPSANPGVGNGGGGVPPPPTGPTNGGLTPSTDGFNETPDPQSAEFWASAARQGTSYRDALHQWQSDVRARGLVGVTPPPPDAYHKAASYIRDHPNVPYQPFNSVVRTPASGLSAVATAAAPAVFSGPGVAAGHTVNALAANLPTALAGEQGSRYNAVSNAMHPNYALAGDVAGTLGGALTTGKVVGEIAPRLGRFGNLVAGNPARAALTGDMAFGGISGAAQNPDNPFGGAALGAGSMAAGNALGRFVVAPGIRAALDSNLVQRGISGARGMFGARPFQPPAALDPGQNLIFNRTGNGIGDIQGNLQSAADLDLPYALADANPRLRLLAGSASRKSPNVRSLAENVIGSRQSGQAERAIQQINNNLAPVGDVPAIKADAVQRAQAASAPLYARAMEHPAPNDPQIMEMLSTPAGQQAARNAYDIALNKGENPAELAFATGPDGQPILNALPNWKTLQYIKMGMDKVILDNENPITGKLDLRDPAKRALNDLRARFVGRLGDLNPDYKAANDAYGSIAGQGTAAERGAAATAIGVTPEQAQIAVTNAGQNLPHFQQGYASSLADQVERQRLSGNPYNLIYGSLGQQAKIGHVFPQGASRFAQANALEGDMSKTAYETLGGSPTAARMEADKAFDGLNLGDTAFDLGVSAATGVPPIGLMQRGIRGLAQGARDRLNLGRGAQAKADAVGPLLLNPDPHANLILLNDIINQGAARQAYLQQLRAAGGQIGAGMFGAPILYGSGQQ